MSDFTHTLRIRAQLDNGTVFEIDNVYTITGVAEVVQGQGSGPLLNIQPPAPLPSFVAARSVSGYAQVDAVNDQPETFTRALSTGECLVYPSIGGWSKDSSNSNTNADDALTEVAFDNSASGAIFDFIGLITQAS